MYRFAGIAALDETCFGSADENRLVRALASRNTPRIRSHRADNAIFAESLSRASPPNVVSELISAQSGCLSVANCRLDNRNEVADALGTNAAELRATSDAALLSRMFERWGSGGIARCLGAFAFAHWDSHARRLTLARDCMGLRTLFFHKADRLVVFANTLPDLLALPWVPREIDELYVANFLALNNTPTTQTFYRNVGRVRSRTMVTIDTRTTEHSQYWTPSFGPPPFRREQDYIERARELFDRAVIRAASGLERLAIATSGGLDSSGIAATAARLGLNERVTCYTMLPPPDYSVEVGPNLYLNEQPKVQALGRMYPALDLRFLAPERAEEFDSDDLRFFARLTQPSFGPVHQDWFGAMERCTLAEGHRVLLTGGYGNSGLTWDGKFALSSLLQAYDWPLLAREAKARAQESGQGLLWTLYADALKQLAPRAVHRLIHRLRGRDPDSVAWYSALNPAYLADHQLARQWQEAGFDPRLGQMCRDSRQHRASIIFDRNQASRDHMAMYEEACGLEARDPYADRELLEFCLSVPEWMYRARGVPRAFARNVLADRLPPEILQERRRGVQGGAWFRRLRRDRIADDIERLEASATAQRLIDLPRLKRLVADWPKDEQAAENRLFDYYLMLSRAVHVGRFIRWVEGSN